MRPTRQRPRTGPRHDLFQGESEVAAKDDVEKTIRNDREYKAFAHYLGGLIWTKSEMSEAEWNQKRKSFVRPRLGHTDND